MSDRLLRHRGGRQRQHELPARRHPLGMLLRPARTAPRGHPRQRRHLRPARHRGPRGQPGERTDPSAVVAGNVETSNRIADTVLAALSGFAPETIPAQGQGTMNNLIIGGPGWTYYETIGGGQGACHEGSWPLGRPRRHEQHAQHPHRGLRDGVPDARRALRAALRLRRGRRAPGRRRHRTRPCESSNPPASPCSPTAGATGRAAPRAASLAGSAATSWAARSCRPRSAGSWRRETWLPSRRPAVAVTGMPAGAL